MNAKALLPLLIALALSLVPATGHAQGFAELGSDAQGFAVPQRGVSLVFPADHGAHPNFRIEWWYVTANLKTSDGRRLGAQWTLFRSALAPGNRPGWADPQIWIGHAAVTTENRHYVAERISRGGVGQAGITVEPFQAWVDDWQMQSTGKQDPLDRLDVRASGKDFAYELSLKANGPLVPQGDRGYSVKSLAGQASYYYSQPFYEVQGTVELDGKPLDVSGKAWLDREWSSQPLASDQTGWDWFSLHLATGDKVMAFRLRDAGEGYISANWIAADGKTSPLASGDVILEPLRTTEVAGRTMPVEWRVRIPSRGLDIKTKALNHQSWMATSTPYWEGPIELGGSVSGEGYLEMTGY